jgi:hypothetical protein
MTEVRRSAAIGGLNFAEWEETRKKIGNTTLHPAQMIGEAVLTSRAYMTNVARTPDGEEDTI